MSTPRRIRVAACLVLCGCAAGAGPGTAAPALAQQPTTAPEPQSTNLGTLIVAPQNAPGTAAKKNPQIQRSALDLNIQPGAPATRSQAGVSSATEPLFMPPQPLRMVPPNYPPAAYATNARGSVTVTFTVKPDGRTTHIRILKAEPPGLFDAAARTAVRQWRFQPATRNGKPVPMTVNQTLIFTPPTQAGTPQAAAKAAAPGVPRNIIPSNVHPVRIVPPRYPSAAYRAQQGGSVTVQFLVMPNGHTADIRVLEATPPSVFNAAAITAVSQWRFRPVTAPTQVVQTIQFNPPND